MGRERTAPCQLLFSDSLRLRSTLADFQHRKGKG
jgi:hypothetical protein